MKKISTGNFEGKMSNTGKFIPAEFRKENNKLIIRNKDPYYSAAFYCTVITDIKEETEYSFSLECIKSSNSRIIPAVIQYNNKGEQMAGDYLINKEENKYENIIKTLKNTTEIHIELMHISFGEAEAVFSIPEICELDKREPRKVTVATAFLRRSWETDCHKNLEEILRIIDNAAKDDIKPDIICFTETAYDRGISCSFSERFISPSADEIDKIRKKAKEHKMYVIFGIHELDEEGRRYNTVLLISDLGEIIGRYRKTHLCYGELKGGIIPGNELPVFELPFGKIGLLICWDQWFPEASRELVAKGAEILFFATAGNPVPITCARAKENGVYVVASGAMDKPEVSFIVNPNGIIISSLTDETAGYVSKTIDLNNKEYVRYLSFERGIGANLYRGDRRDDLYTYYNIRGEKND